LDQSNNPAQHASHTQSHGYNPPIAALDVFFSAARSGTQLQKKLSPRVLSQY